VDEKIDWFFTSLAETIAWCSRSDVGSDPKSSLRLIEPNDFCLDSRTSRVYGIRVRRSRRLARAGITKLQPAKDLQGGRLILFEPDATASDGAAESISQGYFDVHNVPPFDTWVWYVDEQFNAQEIYEQSVRRSQASLQPSEYLIAWVPSRFLEIVNAGIDVIPEECVSWFDRCDLPFARKLRELGMAM
jgi:hypothetical protein